ncbi:MATE family efflux transporter [Sporocytophaga myxococcoides]|nr:MATE family efflux transporter [Sporocytophaga myxococcoides]
MLLKLRSYANLFKIALLGNEKNFTTGSVNRATFLLALPSMLELVMESLFVMVNLLFVSSIGNQAITLAGITNSVILILYSIPTGLSIAATAIISRRIGEKKPEEAGLVAIQVIALTILISGMFSLLIIGFEKPILTIAGANTAMFQAGGSYTTLMFCSLIFMFIRTLMNGIFRGTGNAAMSMRSLTISNLLNVIFCGLFVFGLGAIPALGLTGIGLAALIANVLSVGYQFWYFAFREKRISIGRQQLKLSITIMSKLVTLAFAGIVQYLVPSLSRFLMVVIVARLGESVLAGYIIANRVIMFTVLPAWGIANAAGILTGQNLGAGQPDRAEESVWKAGLFNFLFLGFTGFVVLFFCKLIVGWFTNDAVIAGYSVQYLQFMVIAYFFFGYTMVIAKSLNASGKVNTVTLLYIIMFLIIQLPLAYLLAIVLNWGATGIFVGIAFSEIVLTIGCIFVFKTGKWKLSKL